MQYAIDDVRSKYDFRIVGELPNKNIDTGMGLERVAFIKQGVDNMYETDQVRPVLDQAVELSGKSLRRRPRGRRALPHRRRPRPLVADAPRRTASRPSNEGRGYILRRLMRRAIRSMRLLGVDGPTFPELFAASRDAMKDAYPERRRPTTRACRRTRYAEEETFLRTLAAGSAILDTVAVSRRRMPAATAARGRRRRSSCTTPTASRST